jgi:hypothetical protein
LSIYDDILKQLRLDSESENISVNQKVNNILMRWLFCYRAIGTAGGIVISTGTWKDIIEKMDEDSLLNSLESTAKVAFAILSQNDISLNVDNFIDAIFYRAALYSGTYSHFHHFRDGADDDLSLVFEHQFGPRWSRVLGRAFCQFFNEQFGLKTDLVVSDRNVKILVHTPAYSPHNL